MPISPNAKNLLRVLVGYLATARPGQPQTYPTYGQIAADLGFRNINMPIGGFLQRNGGLSELAQWTRENKHPAITGLIVLQDRLEPGQGYFELFNKANALDRYEWWEEEIRKSQEYVWTSYFQ